MNTLSGQPVDRLPVFGIFGAYGANLTGVDLRTLYSDVEAYVAAQQAMQKEFGFDLVLSVFDYSILAEAFGGEVAWFSNQTPNVRRAAVGKASDALKLPMPDVYSTARMPMVLEVNRRLRDLYKEQVPIVGVLPGPCILPSLLIGLEAWIETILFDPELAQRLLRHTAPLFISWATALLESGADCLAFTEAMAASEVARAPSLPSNVCPICTGCLPRYLAPPSSTIPVEAFSTFSICFPVWKAWWVLPWAPRTT